MTRGRKPDAPALQAAKGHPGKRRRAGKADTRAAELAAAPPASADPLSPPVWLGEAKLRPALAIWRELVPDLKRYNLLDTLDRPTFAMYCVHMADWVQATRDIAKNGHSYAAKNVNGDDLMRVNPAVKVRELAERHILEIGSRFGLDPSSRYKLLRDQSASALGGLFSGQGAGGTGEDRGSRGAEETGDDEPLALMQRASAAPPGSAMQ